MTFSPREPTETEVALTRRSYEDGNVRFGIAQETK